MDNYTQPVLDKDEVQHLDTLKDMQDVLSHAMVEVADNEREYWKLLVQWRALEWSRLWIKERAIVWS